MYYGTYAELLEELEASSIKTLTMKNSKYGDCRDALHNFKVGAAITGQTTAQTCWGYMAKHLASLQDKVITGDFSNREDFLEKCQDTINYIRLLWCIGNEEMNYYELESVKEKEHE